MQSEKSDNEKHRKNNFKTNFDNEKSIFPQYVGYRYDSYYTINEWL